MSVGETNIVTLHGDAYRETSIEYPTLGQVLHAQSIPESRKRKHTTHWNTNIRIRSTTCSTGRGQPFPLKISTGKRYAKHHAMLNHRKPTVFAMMRSITVVVLVRVCTVDKLERCSCCCSFYKSKLVSKQILRNQLKCAFCTIFITFNERNILNWLGLWVERSISIKVTFVILMKPTSIVLRRVNAPVGAETSCCTSGSPDPTHRILCLIMRGVLQLPCSCVMATTFYTQNRCDHPI